MTTTMMTTTMMLILLLLCADIAATTITTDNNSSSNSSSSNNNNNHKRRSRSRTRLTGCQKLHEQPSRTIPSNEDWHHLRDAYVDVMGPATSTLDWPRNTTPGDGDGRPDGGRTEPHQRRTGRVCHAVPPAGQRDLIWQGW